MSIELKSCPFCGEEAELVIDEPSKGFTFVECHECGARGSISKKRQAIKAWNTRAERTCWKLPSSGGKECTVTHVDTGMSMSFGYWKCSECGCECFEGARYCMGCGAKVVE